MVRTRAILLSLCLCTLLASCGGNRHRGMQPAPRTATLEQAHGEADRQLALTAQALVEAQVATQAAQIEVDSARAAVATQVAGLETGHAVSGPGCAIGCPASRCSTKAIGLGSRKHG